MKTLLILSLGITFLFLQHEEMHCQILSVDQQEELKITITPDKSVYKQGEMITFKVEANRSFQRATTGDCKIILYPPIYAIERNGEFSLPYGIKQKCCGPGCSFKSYNNFEFTQEDTLGLGRWKVLIYTCDFASDPVESMVFEVVE